MSADIIAFPTTEAERQRLAALQTKKPSVSAQQTQSQSQTSAVNPAP